MKNKKNKSWLVIGFVVLLIAILIMLIVSSKNNKVNTNLNLSEKRWIEENKKNVINASIANSIPIFSNNGEGIFFDFIKVMEEKTDLSFNLISYDSNSDVQKNELYFEVVKNDKVDSLKDSDMVFYKDYYVLIGKNDEKEFDPNNINGKKIGVLSTDLAKVSFYITGKENAYTSYDSNEALQNALKNDEVSYIAVPKTRYYSFILSNNYHVVYNLTEIKEAYVLNTFKDADNELKSIVNKNYIEYKNNKLEKQFSNYLNSFLLEENNISSTMQDDFSKKKYTYGYIANSPYDGFKNNRLIGLNSVYINSFSEVTGATVTYKKYKTVKDLARALNKNEIDFASSYYNYPELAGKYNKTVSLYSNDYVVLVNKERTDLIVNSAKSLNKKNIIMLDTTLAKYFADTVKANVKKYDRINTLLNKIDKDSIVILDEDTYITYKNNDLNNYKVLYNGTQKVEQGFIIKDSNENEVFSRMFTNYLETINYKQLYNNSTKEYLSASKEVNRSFVYAIVVLLFLVILWFFIRKKVNIKKKTSREQIVRYIDPLTSLKNRHYLNKNFSKWENNSIYPQSIIIINLNNLRHINDVYGHEEGDKLLKQAANILIKNQLEQSDIIRTDGNEYLIYMVGYEKNKVVAYMRKLYKELSELPYGFGATLGYSMIEDDIKTIDDAINEAVLEIRASKEMKNKR